MANDRPMSDVPRYEYFTWAQMLSARTGGIEREDLTLILREARANLSDEDYAQLQRDIKFFIFGGRIA